ncbi:MAG TPA: PP2C family protein-serine/threonine phosphatase [Planctomycetota bacterium]|nr:PP2C family protein-serine/threonine phosphatase [Planctomycetota bacterium]
MPPPTPSHETVVRTNEYEVTTDQRGPFTLVTLRGRFTDDMLTVLQKQVFLKERSLAIDASALSGPSMALARAFYYTAQQGKAKDHALTLINPPDSLRGFFKLLGTAKLPILLSASQLPAKPGDLEAVASKLENELQQVRRELGSNQLWQFVDREYCWVCPFCAQLCDEVRMASRVSVTQAAVERVWRHMNYECKDYLPSNPRFKQKTELEAKVRDSNTMKLNASAAHVTQLRSQVTKLEEKAQWATNLEKGVKIAASRQRKLLPTKAPIMNGCEIAYTYRPADELSGDLFDFVELSDGRMAFVIGDVSGHGIEAGILMGMTKKVLSIRLSEMSDPVAAVKKTNADIVKDMDRSSFVTVSVIVFDPTGMTLTSVRAGHNPPMLYSPSKGTIRKFEGGGLMIGMAQPHIFDAQLAGETVDVLSGDILLLYTDGIEEGKNPAGEEFSIGRMEPVLQSECAKPPAFILGTIFYEFERFAAGVTQEDDLTAICVKFK